MEIEGIKTSYPHLAELRGFIAHLRGLGLRDNPFNSWDNLLYDGWKNGWYNSYNSELVYKQKTGKKIF